MAQVARAERVRLSRRSAELLAEFRSAASHGRVRQLTGALARSAESTLRRLWRASTMPRDCALVAVGGFGRGELYPHSDVDVLILLGGEPDAAHLAAIESFVTGCWDARLELGHSVRTVEQCLNEAAGDVTVQTSLLEMRLLGGRRDLFGELHQRLHEATDPRAFFDAKRLELQQRHQKYQDTPYSLEPNCKESPGGLRDLQTVLWIARAAGIGASWIDLTRAGLITAAEARRALAHERFLGLVRTHLHVLANRREDRLVFDLQTRLAEALGFVPVGPRRASEVLMQRYYWAAKAVVQINTILLQNLEAMLFPQPEAVPEPIDTEFRSQRGLLDLLDESLFEREPSAILRAFLTMQQRSDLTGMSARLLRAIWRARTQIDAAFRRSATNQALFLEILQQPRGVTHELRRMNQLSLLGRYLPPFRRIVGQMQHDLFHVYTVDQHILMVVRNLRRFMVPEHAHEYPLLSELITGFDKPWLLYVAALFHDIAKGRGGDHSRLGRVDAHRFCVRHGIGAEDTALVEWLVEHHLTMSMVAQKRDITDPEVVRDFARLVGNERRLTALYLLTVADIRGTGPKVWNGWKGKLLEDLYRAGLQVLEGGGTPLEGRLDEQRREALRLLNLYGLDEADYREFWATLEVSYFLRNDPQDIAWQTRALYRHASTGAPIVRTRVAPFGEGFQVTVYLKDQPDLFARVCGYFDRKNLSVLDARIYTTRDGYALDNFLVIDPSASGQQVRDILNLIESELTERLRARTPLGPPVRGRLSRRSRYFPIHPQVELRPDERGQRYLLSVTANDRTGLLYSIATVLGRFGLNLYSARIATLGERV
ncbi:MAG: [protein-PII] uridylyltransferase, partial [Burkholderiales bacterium]